MKPHTYNYSHQAYRGWVSTYQGATMTAVNCNVVRTNRLKALEDAKKLLHKLRTTSDPLVPAYSVVL